MQYQSVSNGIKTLQNQPFTSVCCILLYQVVPYNLTHLQYICSMELKLKHTIFRIKKALMMAKRQAMSNPANCFKAISNGCYNVTPLIYIHLFSAYDKTRTSDPSIRSFRTFDISLFYAVLTQSVAVCLITYCVTVDLYTILIVY